MADEKWQEIYASGTPRGRMGSVPQILVARVARPVHPDHCGERHDTDGVMQCPNCKVPAYRVVLHSWFHMDGHYWNSLEPMNGSGPAPLDNSTPVCNCGRQMTRVFTK